MNPLVLSGFDVKIRVSRQSRAEVEFVDGHDSGFNSKQSASMRFRPRQFPYSSILIDGRTGYCSFGALKRLSREGIPIFLTEPDGSILYSILPRMPLKPDVRIGQVQAAHDSEKRFKIALAIVQAKIARSLETLNWLGERYDLAREMRTARFEGAKLGRAATIPEIRTCEGRTAVQFWRAIAKTVPPSLEFRTRMTSVRDQRSSNASEPVNTFWNFGYGFLESEVRRAIHSVGLEAGIGFLHTTADYQSKPSLVLDLMEVWRWIVDVATLRGVESGLVDWKAVYFAEPDFKCRLDNAHKEKFIRLLREEFNKRAKYKNQQMEWSSIITEKIQELARFFTGRTSGIDFMEPLPTLERSDTKQLRDKILSLSSSEARHLGIPKQSLHDLRTKARSEKPFKLYRETRQRLLA
ncbi:MAG: CRISPR-associated endonuclease Cas1 [Candidatus Bathyarchaeia archaeon]